MIAKFAPCVLATLTLAIAAGPLPAAGWALSGWAYRRPVTVTDYAPSELDGHDVAVVRFPTAGQARADGADIRVTTASGQEVPSRVLMMGPGDFAEVAFAPHGKAQRYYVYFGNAKAAATDKMLDIRRGVLLETWKYPGGRFQTLQQARDVLAGAREFIGRRLLDRVFLGHNPFGPDDAIAQRLTAWIDIDKPGQYAFACTSRNASFVTLDGNEVASAGGRHGVQRHVKPEKPIKLTAGLHKMEVFHVSPGGDPVLIAAWAPPGRRHVRPMPGRVFTPFFTAEFGPLEQYAKRFTLDIEPIHAGETFTANRYYQRYAFKAAISGQTPGKVELQWDFGDGQSATQPELNHIYLVNGPYTVTLTARTSSGVVQRRQKIFVSRPWDRVMQNRLGSVRDYARLVLEYDFDRLTPIRAFAPAAVLLDRGQLPNGLLRAGQALVKRENVPAAVAEEVMPRYVAVLLESDQAAKAFDALTALAERTDSPRAACEALVAAGDLALEHLADPNAAEASYRQAVKAFAAKAGPKVLRRARIGLGDVARYRGDYEAAAKQYRTAGPAATRHRGKDAFVKGDFARHVEAYMAKGHLGDAKTYLDRWAETFPAEKLEGYWSLLRTQWYYHKGLWDRAAREARVLVAVNPKSTYAPRLLLTAAEALRRKKAHDRVAELLQKVAEDYPESPLAAQAAEELKKLKR